VQTVISDKNLSYRRETPCRSVSVEMLSTIVRITQTDGVSAKEALSATVDFYSATCMGYRILRDPTYSRFDL